MSAPIEVEIEVGTSSVGVEIGSSSVAVEREPAYAAPDQVRTPTVIFAATTGTPGQPGPPGSGAAPTIERVTATALSGHRVVTPADDGKVGYADATNAAHMHRPLLLTLGAWGSGVTATLFAQTVVSEPSWSWTPGQPIWLGLNGLLTQTIPVGAVFVRRVAEVVDPTTIDFDPSDPIAVI